MVNVEEQSLELKDQLRHTLEEARILLPGIQALFGFQLIAVFQTTFFKLLSPDEQKLHLLAVALGALAAAVTIAPASLHRRAEPHRASARLLRTATWLLTFATWPLALSIALDFGLLSRIVLKNALLSWTLATLLFAGYVGLWVVLPRVFAARAERSLG